MSRLHWARISVAEHAPERVDAIRTAIEDWQDGMSVVSRADPEGSLLFDVTFSLSGAWQMSAAAKSFAYRVGQANGGSCRFGWTVWWVEDGGQIRVEWPAHEAEPNASGAGADSRSGDREFLLHLSVEPTDERMAAKVADLTEGWLSGQDSYGHGQLSLRDGESLVDHIRTWRESLTSAIGGHELTVAAWNFDQPHDERLFTPDHYPMREPEALLQPKDSMLYAMPRFGRCMFCVTGVPLRLIGHWTEPPDPELAAAGIRTIPGRSAVAVCDGCQTALRERLRPVPDGQSGLFESDGNPMGAVSLSPKLACMTCERLASEALLVVNDQNSVVVCRECLFGAAAA